MCILPPRLRSRLVGHGPPQRLSLPAIYIQGQEADMIHRNTTSSACWFPPRALPTCGVDSAREVLIPRTTKRSAPGHPHSGKSLPQETHIGFHHCDVRPSSGAKRARRLHPKRAGRDPTRPETHTTHTADASRGAARSAAQTGASTAKANCTIPQPSVEAPREGDDAGSGRGTS